MTKNPLNFLESQRHLSRKGFNEGFKSISICFESGNKKFVKMFTKNIIVNENNCLYYFS